ALPSLPVQFITEATAFTRLLPELLAAPVLALDTETTGLDPLTDRLRLIQLATPACVAVVDLWHVPVQFLAPLLTAGTPLVGHNLKFDLKFLVQAGLPWPTGPVRDTLLAAQLLGASAEERPKGYYTLDAVTARYLDGLVLDKTWQTSDWSGALSPEQRT